MKTLSNAVACALIALPLAFTLAHAADMPRPGDTPSPTQAPKKESYQINMAAGLIFPNPDAAAVADIRNPQNSDCDMRYTLLLAPSEIERVTDISVEGREDVALFQSDLVRPGETIQYIHLDTPSFGAPLYEGIYKANMLVESFDADTGAPANKNFLVENSIHIMADERDADAAADGTLDIHIYNSSDRAARYAIILSALELREVAGIALYQAGRLSEKDTMIELWTSEKVEAHDALGQPPQISGLPTGEYQVYLVRLVDGEAPYGCSRIMMRVTAQCDNAISAIPELTETVAIGYAQAMVNCEYLLSLGSQ